MDATNVLGSYNEGMSLMGTSRSGGKLIRYVFFSALSRNDSF